LNPQAEKMLGYQRKNVLGQPVERVLIGSDTLIMTFDKIRTQPDQNDPQNVQIFRRSGQSFLARIVSNPVWDGDQLAAIVFFMQDLSMQEMAREQTQLLEQRAILGEITAVFAHEVRNPINNISTGLELVALNLAAEDPNQPILNRMLQDCDRLNELVKSVLATARPTEYTLSRLILEPFLQNVLERFRPRLERTNVSGSLQIEADLPPVFANPRALEQVITNLIVNAIQAMGETGGQVVLNARRYQNNKLDGLNDQQSYIELNVIDNGPGIPTDVQDRIFQAFYTTNSSGTGLGLAIAKRIITAHRGSISVKSFPGGTVFTILLPAIVAEQAKD
jgi:PAS domain S-box-containing protein